MILSFARRFLFIAVPKTASQSIRQRLRGHLAPGDWEQHALFGRRTVPIPPLAALGHGHISAAQIRPYVPPDGWPRLFKFAVVRAPLDRFLSYSYFIHRQSDAMARDPLGTMKQMLASPDWRAKIMLRPQHEFVCDQDGQVLLDFVGRFETLRRDVDSICARLGLPAEALEPINASVRPAGGIALDAELTGMVGEAYAGDFRLFGYPPPR